MEYLIRGLGTLLGGLLLVTGIVVLAGTSFTSIPGLICGTSAFLFGTALFTSSVA